MLFIKVQFRQRLLVIIQALRKRADVCLIKVETNVELKSRQTVVVCTLGIGL
jgi:hypothetical protein